MRIAVVDVAAEKGGALTVLQDFLRFVQSESSFCKNQKWFFYTSIDIGEIHENITTRVYPIVKRSWLHRLYWERVIAPKQLAKDKIDIVFSLQNTSVLKGSYKQIVYFHNVLLLEKSSKYSFLKPSESKLAVYTKFISRYTLRSLKRANFVVCQTETVKQNLLMHNSSLNVSVISPNAFVEKEYMNTASFPLCGAVYPVSPNPYKKVEELIDTVRDNYEWFAKNRFRVFITMTGSENKYSQQIRNKARALGEIVKFTGFLSKEELFELYKTNCLFICSELETFCLPVIEAAFIGTAIVAANYPYAKEATKGINNAYLYTPGSKDELMACFKEVLKLRVLKCNFVDFSRNTWESIIPLFTGLMED